MDAEECKDAEQQAVHETLGLGDAALGARCTDRSAVGVIVRKKRYEVLVGILVATRAGIDDVLTADQRGRVILRADVMIAMAIDARRELLALIAEVIDLAVVRLFIRLHDVRIQLELERDFAIGVAAAAEVNHLPRFHTFFNFLNIRLSVARLASRRFHVSLFAGDGMGGTLVLLRFLDVTVLTLHSQRGLMLGQFALAPVINVALRAVGGAVAAGLQRHDLTMRERFFGVTLIFVAAIAGLRYGLAKDATRRTEHLGFVTGVAGHAGHEPRINAVLAMQCFVIPGMAGGAQIIQPFR